MVIRWDYKSSSDIFITCEQDGVPLLSFRVLEHTETVTNEFSTRLEGVSKGKLTTVNFSYNRKDDLSHVLENFIRTVGALEIERNKVVVSYRTHTVNMRRTTGEDEGKGVIWEWDYRDMDGLITSILGITLVTFYTGRVPSYLVDTRNRAIGLSRSRWRGTVERTNRVTINAMKEVYGAGAEDLAVCIGPNICREYFEVGKEAMAEPKAASGETHWQDLFRFSRKSGRYQMSLWRADEITFREADAPKEQVRTINIYTMCDSDYLFPCRRVGEERGNLATSLHLR